MDADEIEAMTAMTEQALRTGSSGEAEFEQKIGTPYKDKGSISFPSVSGSNNNNDDDDAKVKNVAAASPASPGKQNKKQKKK